MGIHVLSRCETISYSFNNGKISALNTLQVGDFPELCNMLGEEDATPSDLIETCQRFFTTLYGQTLETTMSEAHHRIYSRKKGKPIHIMGSPSS
jgi:hypothetical protein